MGENTVDLKSAQWMFDFEALHAEIDRLRAELYEAKREMEDLRKYAEACIYFQNRVQDELALLKGEMRGGSRGGSRGAG